MDYCNHEKKNTYDITNLLASIDLSRHQNWDDFFDFSRMKIPEDAWTASVRSHRNIHYRYPANYIQIWLFVMTVVGIFYDYRYLLSLAMLGLTWAFMCASSISRDNAKNRKPRKQIQGVAPAGQNEKVSISVCIFIQINNIANFIKLTMHLLVSDRNTFLCRTHYFQTFSGSPLNVRNDDARRSGCILAFNIKASCKRTTSKIEGCCIRWIY